MVPRRKQQHSEPGENVRFDRPLPQNTEAERSVLGSILIDNGALRRIETLVQPIDFYRAAHQAIYAAMLELADRKAEIDLVTVKEELVRAGRLEEVGGATYVSGLTDGIPDLRNVDRYAGIVREKAELRRLILVGNRTIQRALDLEAPEEIASDLIREAADIAVPEERESKGIHTVASAVVRKNDERVAAGVLLQGVPTGIFELDRKLRGIPREVLTLIGAPSSHGKTALAMTLLEGGVRNGQKAAFYSLEMSRQFVTDRLLASLSGVPMERIRDWHELNLFDREDVTKALDALRLWERRYFFAERLRDVRSIIADARKKKATGGLDLIVVDYVQIVGGVEADAREEKLSKLGLQLADLAIELDIAVVGLTQVNKDWQRRPGHRITKDDFFGASSLGHHARVAIAFWRPREHDKTDITVPECLTLLYIDKNSQGKKGDLKFHFDGARQKFTDKLCKDCDEWRPNS